MPVSGSTPVKWFSARKRYVTPRISWMPLLGMPSADSSMDFALLNLVILALLVVGSLDEKVAHETLCCLGLILIGTLRLTEWTDNLLDISTGTLHTPTKAWQLRLERLEDEARAKARSEGSRIHNYVLWNSIFLGV
eukprot:6263465-Amphidinium_carterae.1